MFFPVEEPSWGQIFSTKQQDIKVHISTNYHEISQMFG
jgi:hypothetical protein